MYRLKTLGSIAVGVCVFASACTNGSEDAEAEAAPSVQFGIAVPGGEATEVLALEASLSAATSTDTSFDVVRLFYRWDSPLPDPSLDALAEGRRVHLSVRPRTSDGETILWSELATVQPGDVLYDELVRWVDAVVALGPGTAFSVNHEPETSDSAANGSAEDFKAMWRRVAEVLRDRGGDEVDMVWTMTGGAFSDTRADEWYPGDDVVDVVGADLYNWHTCQGSERPWLELAELIEAPLAFARAHEKPLALPELGTVEDMSPTGADVERKGTWFRNAAETLNDPELAADVDFVAYFNVTAPGGTWPNCVWDYDTSVAAESGFATMVSQSDQ